MTSPKRHFAFPDDMWRLVLAVILLSVPVIYSGVFDHSFVQFDDPGHILGNPAVAPGLNGTTLIAAFATPHDGLWMPLTWVSLALNVSLFGLNAGLIVFTNALLHSFSAWLLFCFVRRLSDDPWAGVLAAALFAAHPLNVESVAWACERKTVLCGVFALLAINSYADYRRAPSISAYVKVSAYFAAALLSKPAAVGLPLLFCLLDIWPTAIANAKQSIRRLIAEKVPFILMSLAICVVTLLSAERSIASADGVPWTARAANAICAIVWYLEKLVFPTNLAVLYPLKWIPLDSPRFLICATALSVICVICTILWIRRNKRWAIAMLWMIAMLGPTLGIVQAGAQAYADRFVYLGQMGVWAVAAMQIRAIPAGPIRRYLMILVFSVSTVFGALAFQQSGYWVDTITLFERANEITPNDAFIARRLAYAYYREKRYDDARKFNETTVRLDPQDHSAWSELGVCLGILGRDQDAIAAFQQALQVAPEVSHNHGYISLAYDRLDQRDLADTHAKIAIQLNPDLAINLSRVALEKKQNARALQQLEMAVSLRPTDQKLVDALQAARERVKASP